MKSLFYNAAQALHKIEQLETANNLEDLPKLASLYIQAGIHSAKKYASRDASKYLIKGALLYESASSDLENFAGFSVSDDLQCFQGIYIDHANDARSMAKTLRHSAARNKLLSSKKGISKIIAYQGLARRKPKF